MQTLKSQIFRIHGKVKWNFHISWFQIAVLFEITLCFASELLSFANKHIQLKSQFGVQVEDAFDGV